MTRSARVPCRPAPGLGLEWAGETCYDCVIGRPVATDRRAASGRSGGAESVPPADVVSARRKAALTSRTPTIALVILLLAGPLCAGTIVSYAFNGNGTGVVQPAFTGTVTAGNYDPRSSSIGSGVTGFSINNDNVYMRATGTGTSSLASSGTNAWHTFSLNVTGLGAGEVLDLTGVGFTYTATGTTTDTTFSISFYSDAVGFTDADVLGDATLSSATTLSSPVAIDLASSNARRRGGLYGADQWPVGRVPHLLRRRRDQRRQQQHHPAGLPVPDDRRRRAGDPPSRRLSRCWPSAVRCWPGAAGSRPFSAVSGVGGGGGLRDHHLEPRGGDDLHARLDVDELPARRDRQTSAVEDGRPRRAEIRRRHAHLAHERRRVGRRPTRRCRRPARASGRAPGRSVTSGCSASGPPRSRSRSPPRRTRQRPPRRRCETPPGSAFHAESPAPRR